jgi:hypothetical protein
MALHDRRVCKTCGLMGVTRHTCPFCPCNFCKKPGHIADNCEKALKSQEGGRRVGSSADGNLVAGGPLSNPFSTGTRRKQPRLTRGPNTDLTAGSGFVAATPAGEDRSSGTSSDSPRRPHSQHSYAHDTSLLPKRKMNPESENARKKRTTSSTVPPFDLIPKLAVPPFDLIPEPTVPPSDFRPKPTIPPFNLIPKPTVPPFDFIPEPTVPPSDFIPEPTVPPFDLMPKSTGNRKPNSNNVSPLLDDEVSYPGW